MKRILHYAYWGISEGALIFIAVNIIGRMIAGSGFTEYIEADFTKIALSSIGIAFFYVFPAILYEYDIPLTLATALHFIIGTAAFCVILIPSGHLQGKSIIMALAASVLAFAIIWIAFYISGKRDEKRINGAIRKKKPGHESGL